MKREIKFRAWDKAQECYLYDVQRAYDTLSGLVKYENGENADYDEQCFDGFLDDEQYIVEQYISLHDKNGKPIYEGDIVHCVNDYEGTDYTGKVMFFNGGFCVWTGGFRNYVWDDMIPEIIGNIHENAELLEVD